MAITGSGFDGTMTEYALARLLLLAGKRYGVGTSGDFAAVQVSGSRAITVAPGEAYAPGVIVTSTATETLSFSLPTAGAWNLVALRRTFATNVCELVVIAGATTTSTAPTARPSTLPTINSNPGVIDDQPLWWAWVNATTTAVTLFSADQTDTGDVLAQPAGGFASTAYFRAKDGLTTNYGSINPTGNGTLTSSFVTIANLPPGTFAAETRALQMVHNLGAVALQAQLTSGAIQIRSNAGTVSVTANSAFSFSGNAWRV